MKMKRFNYILISWLSVFALFFTFACPTYAALGIKQPVENAGVQVNGLSADTLLGGVFRNAITLIFTIASVSAVLVFLWGAVDWILSGGDKEKVASARKKITNALIGLIVLAVSFLVLSLVGTFIGINPLKGLKIPYLGENISTSTNGVKVKP